MIDDKKHDALETEALDLDPSELKRMLLALKKNYEEQTKALSSTHEEELSALRDQLMQLKNHLKASQAELVNREQVVLPNEEFDQIKKRNEQLERVILHLRERTEEAKLETKTLRDELEVIYQKQETAQTPPPETILPSPENVLLHSHYEQSIAENKQLATKLEETLAGRVAAENLLEQLQNQQKENERVLLEESESRLRIAQQHLAKKVKEVTVLAGQYEELQRQYEEIKATLEVTKGRAFEMQGTIDSLKEALRSVDSQAAKWEDKYSRLYDQFQEGELRYRELKKIEEKFVQMQLMLANISSVMGIHSPLTQPPEENNSSPVNRE